MSILTRTCAAIGNPDRSAAERAQAQLDHKTKPRRSLGRLEDLVATIAGIRGNPRPPLPTKAVVVMAGDHGVAEEGVSAYPPEVTRQMVLNFAAGGAAINVLARQAGAKLVVVDMGVRGGDEGIAGVRAHRLGPGTNNFTRGPAMTVQQALSAIEYGISLANELADSGIDLIGIGEMGIGNTTAATALVAAFTGVPASRLTGRGTGIDDAAFKNKIAVIERAIEVNPSAGKSALEILAALGGFEIAGLAGVVLGAAAKRVPVVLDGFIASTAALGATRIEAGAADYILASHRSVEVGHRLVLEELGCQPLFDLNMRLGEGSGAALAMPIIDAALRLLHEMATFGEAGVTSTGR